MKMWYLKRKTKSIITSEKYGGKKGKVSVFEYMGPNPHKVFTRSDKKIRMRGLLPPIPVSAPESDVRREICDVIRTCSFPDLTDCTSDFEFIDMSGKQASIPQCKIGFEWEGRAVRELAGSGCVYVRLTRDVGYDVSDAGSSSGDRISTCVN